MNAIMHQWALDWSLPPHCIHDLLIRLGVGIEPHQTAGTEGWSEAAVQNRVRIDASKAGIVAWRNNVGAFKDESGAWHRYGLANDTKAMNQSVKSSDLIGINPILITPQHVGHTIGQFWARECKEYGWKFKGDSHELAQQKYGQIVIAKGGDFSFTTGAL